MQKSAIEYLKAVGGMTWNPIAMRCKPISAGCANCWHIRMAKRQAANHTLGERRRAAVMEDGTPRLFADELLAPSKRKKPTLIAVQFMGDLFESHVENGQIDSVFSEMARLKRHIFLVLTKRTERMCHYMRECGTKALYLDNIWLGTSVEGDRELERIRLLQATPGVNRWVSFEPLISPVDLDVWDGISWATVGAETGPHKRSCAQQWIASLRAQCFDAGVAFFGKVNGGGDPIEPRQLPPEFYGLRAMHKKQGAKR